MPHCDTLDGPVVGACRKALQTGNVNFILIWVPESAEKELKKAFAKTLVVRKLGKQAAELADYWFYETAVRLHRAGEGEPFTGLKPAGLSEGPVVPKAERAIKKENATAVIALVKDAVDDVLMGRFTDVVSRKRYDVNNVRVGRAYIQSYQRFVVYAHHLFTSIQEGGAHEAKAGGHHH